MYAKHSLMLIAAFALIPLGCTPITNGERTRPDLSSRKARVVVTTTMIADLVRIVGGTHVEVTSLMQAGVDPHQYKPSAGDAKKLQDADLVVYNGLHLEGKMSDVFEELAGRLRVHAVASTLDERELRVGTEGFDGAHDPHIWFDVSLWAKTIPGVRDALIDLDPAHADSYKANADRYAKELANLHDEVKARLKDIPKDHRVLITAHDAFYYFGRAYDFEVRGLQGISTDSEPSTADVRELAEFIAKRRVPAIFGETSVPDRNIEAVRQAVKKSAKFDVKFLGGTLFSDSLGDAGTPEGTYIGMVRHNVNTIAGALK